jgi:hypothetical protein
MSGYSNGIQITYAFAAFAGISSAGQSSEKIAGPAGKTGRPVAMVAVLTTGNTTAAGGITLRNNVTTTELYATLSVPVLAAALSAGDMQVDDVSDSPTETSPIPAGAQLELDGDGLGTAGVETVYVTIEWS